jgi:RNA polymerase sigma-70 factor (ECF subfamily)
VEVTGEARGRAPALPSDDAIVARLRAGDEAMFALILTAWSSGLLRAARAYVSTRESAEDVVQDTWLAVVRGINRFEGRSSLRTWVYRIMINTAKSRGVKDKRTVPMTDLTPEDSGPTVDPARFRGPDDPYQGHWKEFPPQWPSVETEIESRQVRQRIEEAIGRLPARQRIVITLRDVESYSADEVCALLEISAANQRVLLHRARAAVRADLETYFTADEGARR